jgi:hypothetical protein
MRNNSKLNALKTGAYALEPFLPWEDPAEREKLRADIFNDYQPTDKITRIIAESIVETCWMLSRQQKTTAIATHRHAFGRKLEESGAKTWREALSIIRAENIEKTLQSINESEYQIAQTVLQWQEKAEEDGELAKCAKKIVAILTKNAKRLSKIQSGLDAERDFFQEYSPKHLERLVRISDSLHAQLRKRRADFTIALEEAHMRAKLLNSGEGGQGTDNSTVPRGNSPEPRGNVAKDGTPIVSAPEQTSDDARVGAETDDLLRDDTADDWDDESDPLGEFIRENS